MPKGTKVLLVDDDKMLIDLYKERLELAGFNVEISRDGEEGLAKIHTVKPDLVLLDIMMPKVNGYEALASIKSDPATKDTPVIILSALMRDINKSKAIESGADDYIIKSEAMPADVIGKIEAVLKKYHKEPPAPASPEAPTSSPAVPEAAVPEPSAISSESPTPPTAPEPTAPEPTIPAATISVASQPTVEPPFSTPPAPPAAPEQAAAPKTTPPNPEIQFEPSPSIGGQELISSPKPAPSTPASSAPAPAANAVPSMPATQPSPPASAKTSGTITFFLMVILILLLASIASNILLYMRFVAVQ